MPFKRGEPRPAGAGRKKGQLPQTESVRDLLQRMGVDPFAIQAKIASGDVQCGVCHGKGSTKFQPAHGQAKLADRTCESCYGSGKERISPELKQKAADSLGKYCQPQLKQIEVQGVGGGPVLTDIRVHFVKSQDGKPVD